MAPSNSRSSRRSVLAGCVAVVGSLAGCSGPRSGSSTDESRWTTDAMTDRTTATESPSAAQAGPTSTTTPPPDALSIHVTSEEFRPITAFAAAWNVNSGPAEYPHPSDFGIDTELHAADYFASRRGIDPTGERGRPPFPVAVGEADPSDNAWLLGEGRIDLAGTGLEPTSAEALDLSAQADRSEFVPHVVAKGGRQIVVAREVYEAGVTALAPGAIRDIYAGRIENWRPLGGPDREIALVLGAEGTPNRLFQRRFLDGPETGVDERLGRPRERLRAVGERDGGLTDVDVVDWLSRVPDADRTGVRALDALVDGQRVAAPARAYPSVYGVPLFTSGEPDARQGAFLDALRSDYGQRFFENHYGRGYDLLPTSTE